MANMSYCRFENTLSDMKDCMDALYSGVDFNDMSKHELGAVIEMLEVSKWLHEALKDAGVEDL